MRASESSDLQCVYLYPRALRVKYTVQCVVIDIERERPAGKASESSAGGDAERAVSLRTDDALPGRLRVRGV